jgi:hypothetical protein
MNSKFFIIAIFLFVVGCGKEAQPPAQPPAQVSAPTPKLSKLEEERQRNMAIANSAPVEKQEAQLFVKSVEVAPPMAPATQKSVEVAPPMAPATQTNEFLDVNQTNCKKIDGHGRYEREAIARAYGVSMSSVVFVGAEWGLGQFGSQRCHLIFDTAKGPKRCNVFYILTSDKGRTGFGLAVARKDDNPVCF